MEGGLIGRARAGARAAALGAWTAGCVAVVELDQLRGATPAARRRLYEPHLRRWARGVNAIFGVEVRPRWEGGEAGRGAAAAPPPAGRARLVVANHRSPVDITVLLALFGGHVLSRADLAHWPVLGYAARSAGTIFVDRDSGASGAAALRAIRACLRTGATVIVFPEGATHAGDEVRPFRPGAFAALRRLDAEVVPVGLAYEPGTEFIEDGFMDHLARVASRPRLRVGVAVGAPRLAASARTTETLAAAVHDDVQRLVHEARRDV
ncbi:MAG TPA: lysophospholipid acyltransferase family protein [Myxococcota bacterium]|jgi:1-acyl-sn-glycerol-3-phosphate acyltransferase|nr:lysophospholipid acyltransferase family protein [Myxococcota bacterium]